MKKTKTFKYIAILLCIIGTLWCTNTVNAQCINLQQNSNPIQLNALYAAFQPTDLGFGIRADYRVCDLGVYSSVSYGDGRLYRYHDIRRHTKLSTGVFVPLPDYNGDQFNFTVALNYHFVGDATINNSHLNPKIFNPWSFELGLTVYAFSWMPYNKQQNKEGIAIGVRTDILRWEPCIDIGYKF
jgi:hypothetical protein